MTVKGGVDLISVKYTIGIVGCVLCCSCYSVVEDICNHVSLLKGNLDTVFAVMSVWIVLNGGSVSHL